MDFIAISLIVICTAVISAWLGYAYGRDTGIAEARTDYSRHIRMRNDN